jgi:hypothetical protein
MAAYSHAQLLQRVEVFVTNGAKAEAQAVLVGVGVTPAELAVGQALADVVAAGRAETKALLAAQKNATEAERAARRLAERELNSLARTARLLFAGDEAALTSLGLQTRYRMVVDVSTGQGKRQVLRPSQATAEVIARWQQLMTNALALAAAEKGQLTAAGWGDGRISAAQGLVAAYATADTAQRQARQAYQQASGQYQAAVAALNRWYTRVRALSVIAIKDMDPTNQQNLRELLGFNL